jgi:hypothetical protein
MTTEDSLQCSLGAGERADRPKPHDIANLKRLSPTGPKGIVASTATSPTSAWTPGHIGATPELTITNVTNPRMAPERPEKAPEMTGGPGIRGLRWWAILGLNQ